MPRGLWSLPRGPMGAGDSLFLEHSFRAGAAARTPGFTTRRGLRVPGLPRLPPPREDGAGKGRARSAQGHWAGRGSPTAPCPAPREKAGDSASAPWPGGHLASGLVWGEAGVPAARPLVCGPDRLPWGWVRTHCKALGPECPRPPAACPGSRPMGPRCVALAGAFTSLSLSCGAQRSKAAQPRQGNCGHTGELSKVDWPLPRCPSPSLLTSARCVASLPACGANSQEACLPGSAHAPVPPGL